MQSVRSHLAQAARMQAVGRSAAAAASAASAAPSSALRRSLPLSAALPNQAAGQTISSRSLSILAHSHARSLAASSSPVAPFRLVFLRSPAQLRQFSAQSEGKQQQQQQQQSEEGEGASFSEKSGPSPGQAYLGVVLILGVIAGVGGGIWYAFIRTPPTPSPFELEQREEEENKPFYTRWGNAIKGILFGDSKLLPPEALDPQGRRPRTLVLNFDKTLVHCEWTRSGGWQVRKRPGVDRFLERAARSGYELVLWASMAQYEVDPALAELDPAGYFKHKLYNEHTNFKWEGAWPKLVKDISRLNRDKRRLIVVDVNQMKYTGEEAEKNVMVIPEFVDDINDRQLANLSNILENIQRYNIHDVTSVISRYNANPSADLFAKERELAAQASRNLKGANKTIGGLAAHRSKQQQDEDDEEDEDDHAHQAKSGGLMSYIKSWLPKAKPTTVNTQAQQKGGVTAN